MSDSADQPRARRVWFDEDNLWVELVDGRTLGVPLAYFPRLANATPAQREQCVMSGGGTGLHWDELDEDISVRGLLEDDEDRRAALKARDEPGSVPLEEVKARLSRVAHRKDVYRARQKGHR